MPKAIGSITLEDRASQISTITVHLTRVADDFSNFAAVKTAFDNLVAEIDAISQGVIRKTQITLVFSGDENTVGSGARESKWIVTYKDTTQYLDVLNTIQNTGFGRLYSVEIPMADFSTLPVGTELADLSTTPWSTLIPDFTGVVKTPYNWNAANPTVQVVSARKVGRNT